MYECHWEKAKALREMWQFLSTVVIEVFRDVKKLSLRKSESCLRVVTGVIRV